VFNRRAIGNFLYPEVYTRTSWKEKKNNNPTIEY